MKNAVLLMLMLLSVFAVACGGNAPANGAANSGGGGHGHGDEHGKMTEIGKKKIDDRDVTVSVSEWKPGAEGVSEVAISGDGADKLKVQAWITDADGKEASPKANGEWAADEKMFDCHVELRKDLKPGKYKLWIEIEGKKESWDVEIHG